MVDFNTSVVLFNVLRAEVCAPSLKLKDLFQIKTAVNLSFSLKLQYITKIFYENFNLIPTYNSIYFKTYDAFIRYASYYELESIAYTYTLTTYQTIDDNSYERPITCPNCENTFKYDVSIEDFASIKNIRIWDKDRPYYEYVFMYSDNNNINIEFMIPNILTFVYKLRGITNTTIMKNIDKYSDILDPITTLVLHTRKIKVKDIEIDKPDEIYEFYSNLPAQVYKNILTYFNNNIYIYKPTYKYDLTCPICQHTFQVSLSPLLEFISITDKNKTINDLLDEFINYYNSIYITSNQHFTDIESFFNLPLPVFLKLSKEFLKLYEQKARRLQHMKKNLSVSDLNDLMGML